MKKLASIIVVAAAALAFSSQANAGTGGLFVDIRAALATAAAM